MLDQLELYEPRGAMYEDNDSPHKMPMYPMSGAYLDAHHTWYQAREHYATAPMGEEGDYAREVHMRTLLESVSLTNPPVNRVDLNPPPAVKPERPQRSTARMAGVFILTYLSIMLLWVMIVIAIS